MEQKKLLILGGASVHCKVVEAAREMGLYTIVTDYLPDSPAKQFADKSYLYDICDVESIVSMCQNEGVHGVISSHLDPCQRPYQQICEKLGLPCFGTQDQFFKLTDKHAFKQMCRDNGVDVIDEYTVEDIENGMVEYPIFIKPVDSRGSRGQSVCYDKTSAKAALEFARGESSNGDLLIEKYLGHADEVQITYFLIDGEPYLVRTVDSYRGKESDGLEKVVMCAVSPSKYTDEYLAGAHKNVVEMLKSLGLQNGPAFIQGFYDEGKFRFFDPGLRFPGVDYERVYRKVFGIDLVKLAIQFAMGGPMDVSELPKDSMKLDGNYAGVLFPVLRAGLITGIEGEETLKADKRVVSYLHRHFAGERLGWTADVNQRLSEIDVLCESKDALRDMVSYISDTLHVWDELGAEMCLPLKEISF